jgi:glycosyltransferase involved in cell wall biosynthesis
MVLNQLNKEIHQLEKEQVQSNLNTQVIIAALNEEEGIGLTITEMMDALNNPQVLVVDGNSTDRTIEVAKNLGAAVALQEGKGKGDALAKGLEHLNPEAKYIVITDADYTYPAESVPDMIKHLEENPEVGMVCGNRLNGNVQKEALHRVFHIGNLLIAFTYNLLSAIPLKDPLTGLRVVRADILRDWKVKSKGFDIEVELNRLVEKRGYGIVEVPIQYRERLGQKKLGIKHGAEIFRRIIAETFN